MKKSISRWLFALAKLLNPAVELESNQEARPMGLCIHISKKDVRDFRKNNPEIKSHREGMKVLIEEAKWRVAGAIGRGMMDKGIINFTTKKTLYVADVSGVAFVYDAKESQEDAPPSA